MESFFGNRDVQLFIGMSLHAYAVLREWSHISEKKQHWTGAGLKQAKGPLPSGMRFYRARRHAPMFCR